MALASPCSGLGVSSTYPPTTANADVAQRQEVASRTFTADTGNLATVSKHGAISYAATVACRKGTGIFSYIEQASATFFLPPLTKACRSDTRCDNAYEVGTNRATTVSGSPISSGCSITRHALYGAW